MHGDSRLFAHLHISMQTLNKYNYDQVFQAYDRVYRTQLNYQMQSLLFLYQSNIFFLLMFLFLTLWSYFALCFLQWICVGKNLSVEISIYEATVLQSILRDSHCMSCSLECLWVSWNTNVHLWEKQKECLFWPLLSSRSKESQASNAQLSAPARDNTRSMRTTPWTSDLF